MLIPFSWAYSTEFQSLAKYHQICHICQTCRIRRPVGTLLLSLFNWISIFSKISSNLPYLPSSPNSLNSLLCWYPSLELIQLNFSLWWNSVTFAMFANIVEFVEFAALLLPFTWPYLTEFKSGEISSNLPYLTSSSNSLNSLLCWYPSLELIQLKFSLWRNIIRFAICAKFVEFPALLVPFSWVHSTEFQSLVKYRHIRHICQIRRIPWIRYSVGTLLLSLFNWILVFSEISSHSQSLPSSSNSLNSLFCWYPSLELIQLNFSLAKCREICHICQVRRIRWIRYSVGTLLLSLFNWISVWRNVVEYAIFAKFVEFVEFIALLVTFSWVYSTKFESLAKYCHWFAIFAKFVEFVEFAAMLIPFSWAYLTEFQSLAKYRQICHICQVRRIRWIRYSVGTLLLSLFTWISVWRNVVKYAIFAKFVEFVEFIALLVTFSWVYSTKFESLAKYCHWFAIFAKFVEFVEFAAMLIPFSWAYSTEFQSLAKYRQICHICQVRRIRWIHRTVGNLLLSLFN